MKKYLFILAAILVTAGIYSCETKETASDPLAVVSADQSFGSRGGTGTIALKNVSGKLEAVPEDTWCQIENIYDDMITFSVASMVAPSSRTTVIEITAGNDSESITISQDGLVFTLEETKGFVGTQYTGSTEKFFYTKNNSRLEARPNETLPDWITGTHEQDGFKMVTKKNNGGTRTCEFTLSLYDGNELFRADVSTVTITQLGFLKADNFPGEWTANYTAYPPARETPYLNYLTTPTKGTDIAALQSEAVTTKLAITADKDNPNKFTAKLSGYSIAFEIDPTTTNLSIPGYQSGLGTVKYDDVDHDVSFGSVSLDTDGLVSASKVFFYNEAHFVKATPVSEDVDGGVKVTYKFVSGYVPKPNEVKNVTGLLLLAENTSQNGSMKYLYGMIKEIYNELSISRVYKVEAE